MKGNHVFLDKIEMSLSKRSKVHGSRIDAPFCQKPPDLALNCILDMYTNMIKVNVPICGYGYEKSPFTMTSNVIYRVCVSVAVQLCVSECRQLADWHIIHLHLCLFV